MKNTSQKIYKELSEAATRYYDARFFKKEVPQKTLQEYVIARERASTMAGKKYVKTVDEQSKNLFKK